MGEPIPKQPQKREPVPSNESVWPLHPRSTGPHPTDLRSGALGWTVLSCCAYIVISIGRIGELVPELARVPLAKIAIGSALVGFFFEYARLARRSVWATSVGRVGTYLFALSIASVLFSIWRSNSLATVRDHVVVLGVAYALIYKCAAQWRDIEALLKALVVTGAVLAVTALSGYAGGRAEVRSMYDTNDLAFVLVAILPIAVAFGVTRSGTARLAYLAIAVAFAVTILLTASRGGFIGLVAVAISLAFSRIWPWNTRKHGARTAGIVILLAGLCGLTWVSAPSETQERIASILSLGSDYNLDPTESNGRLAIWKRNFAAGVKRPIGYGVGSFGVVDGMTGGSGRAPHNTLLETFVELGAIGLLLLIRLYWVAISQLTGIAGPRKSVGDGAERDVQRIFARCLSSALIGTLVSGFFLSMLKANLLWTLFALAAAVVASDGPSASQRLVARRAHERVDNSIRRET